MPTSSWRGFQRYQLLGQAGSGFHITFSLLPDPALQALLELLLLHNTRLLGGDNTTSLPRTLVPLQGCHHRHRLAHRWSLCLELALPLGLDPLILFLTCDTIHRPLLEFSPLSLTSVLSCDQRPLPRLLGGLPASAFATLCTIWSLQNNLGDVFNANVTVNVPCSKPFSTFCSSQDKSPIPNLDGQALPLLCSLSPSRPPASSVLPLLSASGLRLLHLLFPVKSFSLQTSRTE